MNQTKQQELLDFWEYEQGFDTEDGSVSIDEYITNDAKQQEMQNELNYISELELERELHPIADDDFQPEDEHPARTLLKRDIRAIALKRMEDAARSVTDFEDVIKQWDHLDNNRERKERYHEIGRNSLSVIEDASPLDIIIPAPINHTYWRQIMKGDFIDVIFNCPFEMHESITDEGYSQIIHELKDEHKELIYHLYMRDYSTKFVASLRNQSDRNIRGVRSTILGQIAKKVLLILVDRQGQDFPFTGEELAFLSKHEADIPAALDKLDKEKIALIKKIGVLLRKITRAQKKQKK